jgi:hypothetical protein
VIELRQGIETRGILAWLEKSVFNHLTHDVSSYARGRNRAWLRIEPPLGPTQSYREGLFVSDPIWYRLQEIINWEFDYCLVTFSGREIPIGIAPHRDSSYADFEAYGLNVSGNCKFSYWNDRESFSSSPSTGKFPLPGPPSHVLNLLPGDLVRFNCKNVHAAEPSINRWNMNFWKKKP